MQAVISGTPKNPALEKALAKFATASFLKKILEILHGEIRAESRPGKGTVFSVMLPVEG